MLFEIANLPYILLTAGVIVAIFAVIPLLEKQGSLDSFKSRPVGDGQHGTARWATPQEIRDAYLQVPFTPQLWRKRQNLPKAQGLVVGSFVQRKKTIALIDPGDVHCLMIGASGWEVLFYASTAALGIASLSFASVGYWLRNLYWWERLILLAGAITLITPGAITDAIGCGLLVVIYISQKMLTSGPVSKTAG